MKRGLMDWNKTELPEEELASRIAAFRQAMAREKLDAAVIYGDSYETGDLNYLTNFAPYWFNTMLVLGQDWDSLVTSLNARVHNWIRETSRVSEVKAAKNLGRDAGTLLREKGFESGRIGVTRLDSFPHDIYSSLQQVLPNAEIVDVTPIFEALRTSPSSSEIKLLATAGRIGASAIEAATGSEASGRTQSEVAAEIEHKLRYSGAEDLYVLISSGKTAPNWPGVAADVVIDGSALVRVMCAYKGHWAEVARTIPGDYEPAREANNLLQGRFERAVESLKPGARVGEVVARLSEGANDACRGICAIASYTALPDIEGEWDAEQAVPHGAVVVLRAGLITPAGTRAVHSDTFLVSDGGAMRLSRG